MAVSAGNVQRRGLSGVGLQESKKHNIYITLGET